jgi:transposase-like protein
MTNRAMFLVNVESAAKRHGFSFQVEDGRINMSKRNGAGDDEPHPAVIASAKALAQDLAKAYPVLKEKNGIEMLFIDEWVDLVIDPDEVFNEKEQKS